mmetsp:Transcript_15828/g.51857  ORF Transcript_15828/g.51857 Transcript_15828/m.51857 type:complete len:445 (+) Transcript_15828:1201-2535(+)
MPSKILCWCPFLPCSIPRSRPRESTSSTPTRQGTSRWLSGTASTANRMSTKSSRRSVHACFGRLSRRPFRTCARESRLRWWERRSRALASSGASGARTEGSVGSATKGSRLFLRRRRLWRACSWWATQTSPAPASRASPRAAQPSLTQLPPSGNTSKPSTPSPLDVMYSSRATRFLHSCHLSRSLSLPLPLSVVSLSFVSGGQKMVASPLSRVSFGFEAAQPHVVCAWRRRDRARAFTAVASAARARFARFLFVFETAAADGRARRDGVGQVAGAHGNERLVEVVVVLAHKRRRLVGIVGVLEVAVIVVAIGKVAVRTSATQIWSARGVDVARHRIFASVVLFLLISFSVDADLVVVHLERQTLEVPQSNIPGAGDAAAHLGSPLARHDFHPRDVVVRIARADNLAPAPVLVEGGICTPVVAFFVVSFRVHLLFLLLFFLLFLV